MNVLKQRTLLLTIVLISLISSGLFSQPAEKMTGKAIEKLKAWNNPFPEWKQIALPRLDSIHLSQETSSLTLFYAPGLSYYPFREDSYHRFMQSVRDALGKKFRKYRIEVVTNTFTLDQLVPNYFREELPVDSSRFPFVVKDKSLLVRKLNSPVFTKGLSDNSIALWHSHGYYFEMNLDRWEYQRAKLFGTVEDISVMGYVVPYLTRMLENAGANVLLPRERDIQVNEVITDNDRSSGNSEVVLHLNSIVEKYNEGFLLTDTLFPGFNPFRHGSSLRIKNDSAVFLPEIPQEGYYSVYVSYPARQDNCRNVIFRVRHTGGATEYIVDQTIGGDTWIYLGTFHFRKGKNIENGSVVAGLPGNEKGFVALDAVRFGGGMGNVARRPSTDIIRNQQSANENSAIKADSTTPDTSGFTWKLSGKPRFLEAARYYLQYAGMPDTLVYSPNTNKNDYNDDYQSRGLWVNYLIGNTYPSGKNSVTRGLGLPVDISFAFHTDAGITPDDSIIGTLAIYSTGADNGKFPDGSSRMASRDLSDIIQTQVVDDIQAKYKTDWTRRGLWDKPYSEARRPNVPGTLLELLSHQNLADQRFGLDPRFRFDVCRSVYKGILKYLCYTEGRDYVVQPLPISHFAVIPVAGKTVKLSWEHVIDSIEPTSKPDRYIIYKRIGDNGFDNGTIVNETHKEIELESYDTLYSFKITAVNEGGESFDSEILSVGLKKDDNEGVLVVNGFDRICGPEWFDSPEMAGVAWWKDRGVADHHDFINIGDQYDYIRKAPWLDDDSPGWGASYSDMAGKVMPGNNFDFSCVHGKAILSAGNSFYSVSDEYFCSPPMPELPFKTIDLIFGEEKSTPFFYDTSKIDFRIYTPDFMDRIKSLAEAGKSIFMSGAYVGSELLIPRDSSAIKLAEQYLHFKYRTDHAVKTGGFYATDYAKQSFSGNYFFNTDLTGPVYQVEAPDAIEPAGKGAVCAFRYSENNSSAGVAYRGKNKCVILGLPFETIEDEEQRNLLMKQILNYLKND
jgi:N-acetylmuramoyl-L-alanine amidase